MLERLNKLGFDKIIHQSENLVKKNISTNISTNYNNSARNSLPRSASNYNINNAENATEKFVEGEQIDTSTDSIMNNREAERIYRREAIRYGLGEVAPKEMSNISFARADIDARLGREFMFEGAKGKYSTNLMNNI